MLHQRCISPLHSVTKLSFVFEDQLGMKILVFMSKHIYTTGFSLIVQLFGVFINTKSNNTDIKSESSPYSFSCVFFLL